jgi:hypothetical protein
VQACGSSPTLFASGSGGATASSGHGGAGPGSSTTTSTSTTTTSSSSATGSGGASTTSTTTTTGSGRGGGAPAGTVQVLTNHNDSARTGANLAETALTTSNVAVTSFGRLFARPVDDEIYAQPLIVPGVTIPGMGTHDVVYVATMNDSIYAFDAADPTAQKPLWQVSFLDAANGVTPVDHTDVGWACGVYSDISGHIGVLSTPVIDPQTRTLYAVAKTKENTVDQVYRLHALDLATGAERPGSPVVISAHVPGTGAGNMGGVVTFDPVVENQRSALTLANGNVYIAFASYCDTGTYHGWVLAYDAATLAPKAVFNDTPDGAAGGIWMSGQGLSVDATGNLYLLSGNGTFDGLATGPTNFGTSFVKLSPALGVLDWFTPYNGAALNAGDLDLGSSGALILPGSNLVIGGGKDGNLYVVDGGNLGHFNATDNKQIVQTLQVTNHHVHGSPIVWDLPSGQLMYVWGEFGYLNSYQLVNGQFQQVGQSVKPAPDGMPGGMLSVSANGTTPGSGIIWATHPLSGDANQAVRPGILQAFDAADLTKVLWDTQRDPARDDFGNFAKFCPPTVANGKVYLATFSKQLVVYGLSSFSDPCQNGKQDPGETGIDCGGPCAPCPPHVFDCAPPGAMSVGNTLTCDLGAVQTVTNVGLSVGCADGETGTYTLAFDPPSTQSASAACNTSFAVAGVLSRYVKATMLTGGGADMHIQVVSFTVTYK